MATATMEEVANKTEIKEAMSELGLDNWVDDLMDEIELNRRLKISLDQDDRGMTRPADEVIEEILGELENGTFRSRR